ncbi:MAG TPA: hypothetical protein PLV51_07235 [Lentimicrobium sp.]|jgi:hypothetical protein|nr:hypothetical protein [Lentimicrobium sp.]
MESNTSSNPDLSSQNIFSWPSATSSLNELRKWTTFFGILALVGLFFMAIITVVMMVVIPKINDGMDMPAPYPIPIFILMYLITIAIYILPLIYLFRFSKFMNLALKSSDNGLLSQALRNLMLHFRTVGILTIVFISLYLLILVTIIVVGTRLPGFPGMTV